MSSPASALKLENVLYEKKGPIAYVTINRPKVLNALNAKTISELRSAFEDARDVESGIGQEPARRGMGRIGGPDQKSGDGRAMGRIGRRMARLDEGALMQLAAGEGRQPGRQCRIDHADAQARAAALAARPADHAPRIIRRR